MAKPDCDDGWLRYAHELDAALAVADFTKGARIVLREVFAQIFGPARRRLAELSPAEIGRRVGMPRPHVMRGINELLDSDVLVRAGDGAYSFVKDYERWTYKGQPRLSATEVAYARHAPRVALSYKYPYSDLAAPDSDTHQPNTQSCVTNPGNGPLPNEVTPVTNPGNDSLPNEVTPEPAPYRNGRAEFKTETLETTTPGATMRDNNPSTPDPAKVAELERLARVVLGDRADLEFYPAKVTGWLHSYPADWVRDAIFCTGAKTDIRPGGLAQYTAGCLRRWCPDGPPRREVREAERIASAARPAPQPAYHTAPACSARRRRQQL